jgi:preprotein translocase subunit YajC
VSFLIIMVLMLGVMYVLMIRPQRQRQAQQQSMIDAAGVGDDVLTTGGIYGTVSEAEGDDIVVEIANGVSVHMTRRGIAAVLPPEADEDDEVVDGELEDAQVLDDVDEDSDEDAVTDGEEAVRAAAGEVPAGDDRR